MKSIKQTSIKKIACASVVRLTSDEQIESRRTDSETDGEYDSKLVVAAAAVAVHIIYSVHSFGKSLK